MANGNWQAFLTKNLVTIVGFLILTVAILWVNGQDKRFEFGGVLDAMAQEQIKENGESIKELQKEKADAQDTKEAIAKVEKKVDALDAKFDEKFDGLTTAIIEWKNNN